MFGKHYDYSLIQTTSKQALKLSALLVANYDLKKASEIYDYFAKDMPNMPDFEPVKPTTFEQVKDTAIGVFQWGKENQEQIASICNFFLSAFGKNPIGAATPVEVPPPPPVS